MRHFKLDMTLARSKALSLAPFFAIDEIGANNTDKATKITNTTLIIPLLSFLISLGLIPLRVQGLVQYQISIKYLAKHQDFGNPKIVRESFN